MNYQHQNNKFSPHFPVSYRYLLILFLCYCFESLSPLYCYHARMKGLSENRNNFRYGFSVRWMSIFRPSRRGSGGRLGTMESAMESISDAMMTFISNANTMALRKLFNSLDGKASTALIDHKDDQEVIPVL